MKIQETNSYAFDTELMPLIEHSAPLQLDDIPALREQMAAFAASMPQLPLDPALERTTAEATYEGVSVRVEIVRPRANTASAPAVLWFHGGGWVIGQAADSIPFLAGLAGTEGVVGISVDYDLSPEARYPRAAEQGFAALQWLVANAVELGIDTTRIVIGGTSAGGALAASVSLMARDRGAAQAAFQALEIPVLDDRLATESMRAFTDTPLWSLRSAQQSWAAYLPQDMAEADAYAAPARAEDLGRLPPTYICVAQYDPLRDEGIDYAQRLAQAGVPTDLHLYPGTFHGSAGVGAQAAVSRRQNSDLAAAIGRAVRA